MRNALRLATLLAFMLAAAASATRQGTQQPPPQPYPQANYEPGSDIYSCTDLDGPSTHGSLCFLDAGRCEEQRASAENGGIRATPCRGQTPVSCFQRAGAPGPSSEICAARVEDCDLWRLIDGDRYGRSGPACEWRHAGVAQPVN